MRPTGLGLTIMAFILMLGVYPVENRGRISQPTAGGGKEGVDIAALPGCLLLDASPSCLWYPVGLFRHQTPSGERPVRPQAARTLSVTACGAVYDAARAAGFTDANARIAAKIAEAESGCGAAATCDSCAGVREYSVGPFQINLLAHPRVTEACAREVYCAARAVLRISGGTNFRPWSTYTSGRYLRRGSASGR